MARPKQEGLSYFPLDVDIFSDKKIKILKARYGSDGIALYMYLLCQIYKEGYYIAVDDDFDYIVSDDLSMNYEKIGQIRNFLLERSLFDDKLFKSDKVLTSAGIQRRFQQAIMSRAKKRQEPVVVNQSFWLLSKNETESFIQVRDFLNNSENNSNNSENNSTKKSKENKRKVNESKVVVSIPTLEGIYRVTEQQLQQLQQQHPRTNVIMSLQRMENYMTQNEDKRKSNWNMETYIKLWIQDDARNGKYKKQDTYGAAYDLEAYEKMNPFDE